MIDLPPVMSALAKDRPVFHSEADFQHALAWEIHRRWPETSVRLEFRVPKLGYHLDTWMADRDSVADAEE